MQFKNEVEEPNVTVEFSTPVSACLVSSVYIVACKNSGFSSLFPSRDIS